MLVAIAGARRQFDQTPCRRPAAAMIAAYRDGSLADLRAIS